MSFWKDRQITKCSVSFRLLHPRPKKGENQMRIRSWSAFWKNKTSEGHYSRDFWENDYSVANLSPIWVVKTRFQCLEKRKKRALTYASFLTETGIVGNTVFGTSKLIERNNNDNVVRLVRLRSEGRKLLLGSLRDWMYCIRVRTIVNFYELTFCQTWNLRVGPTILKFGIYFKSQLQIC